MIAEIQNNDFRDWILFTGVNIDNFTFEVAKHKGFLSNLNDIDKARFNLALKEMLMNNTLVEHQKGKIYLVTSLGREIFENGSFSAQNPRINAELNLNEQFSKNLDLNKRVTYTTLFVAIATMIILAVQTYISTKPSIVKIDSESTKKVEQELSEIKAKLHNNNLILKDTLKK